MQQSPYWEANRFSTGQEKPLHFTELEDSLQRLQVTATCPYQQVFSLALQPSAGYGLLVQEVSWSHTTRHIR
jgi:hypothetical protein